MLSKEVAFEPRLRHRKRRACGELWVLGLLGCAWGVISVLGCSWVEGFTSGLV